MKKAVRLFGSSMLIVCLYFIFEYLTLQLSQLLYGEIRGSEVLVHSVVALSVALAAYLVYILEFRDFHAPTLKRSSRMTSTNFLLVFSALLMGKLSIILMNLFSEASGVQWFLVDCSRIQGELTMNPIPISTIIFIGLLTPITEEILFRKLLTEYLLSRKIPKNSVYLMVATGFALIHFSSFSQLIKGLACGLLYGAIYFFTGNLFYSILAHGLEGLFSPILFNLVINTSFSNPYLFQVLNIGLLLIIWLVLLYQVKKENPQKTLLLHLKEAAAF